jgi:hypothetical protein
VHHAKPTWRATLAKRTIAPARSEAGDMQGFPKVILWKMVGAKPQQWQ